MRGRSSAKPWTSSVEISIFYTKIFFYLPGKMSKTFPPSPGLSYATLRLLEQSCLRLAPLHLTIKFLSIKVLRGIITLFVAHFTVINCDEVLAPWGRRRRKAWNLNFLQEICSNFEIKISTEPGWMCQNIAPCINHSALPPFSPVHGRKMLCLHFGNYHHLSAN